MDIETIIKTIVDIFEAVTIPVLVFMVQGVLKDNKRLRDERKNRNMNRQEAIAEGIKNMLMIQLIEYHDKYFPTGEISTHAYTNFKNLYKSYKALGGNGLVTKMKEEIETLKIV